MSDFDPDAYLAQKGAGGFNPDSYLAAKQDQMSAPLAGALGLGQGATMGFGDELAGVVGASLQKAGAFGASDPNKTWLDLYRENRAAARNHNAKAAGDQPEANLAGNVVGGIASSALVPGSGAPQTFKTAAQLGGLLGAVNGLGSSNADLTRGNVGGAIADTATGAALGVGAGVAGHAAGQLLEGSADALKGFANKQALASMRGTAGDYSKILGRGQVDQLGDFLLKEQVPGTGPAVTAGALPEDIADKLEGTKAAGAALLNRVLPQLDAAGQAAGISAIDHPGITRSIGDLIQKAQAAGPKAQPIVDALVGDLTAFTQNVPGVASFSDAEAIKRGYWDAAKKALSKLPRDRTAADDVNIMLGGIVKDSIEQRAEDAARAVGQPALLEDFLNGKRLYGQSENLLGIAGRAEGRAFARNIASPSDKMASAMEFANAKGAGAGNVEAGAKSMLAAAINNQVRRRTASTLASAAQGASTKLQRIAMTSPGKLGAYGPILGGALARGGQEAFNAHAYVLGQTDPKFQAMQQRLAQEHDDE